MEKIFENVDDTREIYLILIVHGIGNVKQYQDENAEQFTSSINFVQSNHFPESRYKCEVRMIDWNSILKTEQTLEKVKRVTISQMGDSDSYRNMINQTGLDILFYLGKHYRPKILKRVVEEARKHYLDLFENGKNKRFKGRVSIVAHSLGSVITYDLMTRQFPEYWLYRPTKDFEDTMKAAKGEVNFEPR